MENSKFTCEKMQSSSQANLLLFITGAIELQVVHREASYNPMQFHVDLDSVYKTPDGLLIYELDRVNVEEQNRWQLLVWVCLIDNSHQICNSKPFRLRTKPRPKSRSESSGINGGENTLDTLLIIPTSPEH